jgi:hypothetical protein
MDCITPPALDNVVIAMYVDGEADEAVVAHIQQCPYCRERARQWTHLQNRLKKRSYRVNCPTPMELGEYHLGYLSDARELVIAQHLRECLLCRREVAQLEEYLQSDKQPVWRMSVKVLIARLVGGQGSDEDQQVFSSSPAFTGVRGESDEPFIYQADNIRIMIEIEDDVEQMGFKSLLGLVTGLDTNEFTIQVSQGEQVIAAASVDDIGNFVISHLSPGHYKLIFSGPNIEIHIPSLPVI